MQRLRHVFAENVRRIRQEKKYSQEQLADLCELHRTYISDVERGTRNISIDNIEKIAIALRVTATILLEEAEDDNQ